LEEEATKEALKLLSYLNQHENTIRAIGFYGSQMPWDFLVWTLVPLLIFTSQGMVNSTKGKSFDSPKRTDGGDW
jgi:hypothetical protein